MKDVLFSAKRFTREFRFDAQYQCCCQCFSSIVPKTAWSKSGHLAAKGVILLQTRGLSEEAKSVLVGNALQTVFPNRREYIERFIKDTLFANSQSKRLAVR